MNKSAFQYTAHCRHCFATRALTRDQVETGRNPICEGCGGAMVVCLGSGAAGTPAHDPERAMRSAEGS